MRTLDRLNDVIDYIEKNINDEINLNRLATIACSSLYDFQRMFGFVAGISVAEYIRKRRLALAASELRQNGAKVTDVALKYTYNSPVSFARAFQAFHGVAPNKAKNSDVPLKNFPRLLFKITVKEVSTVLKTEKITVDGKEYEASYFGEQEMASWHDLFSERKFWRLENAFHNFNEMKRTNDVLPFDNYPMDVEIGEVFVIDYHLKKDGSVNRTYFISNGLVWEDYPCTEEVLQE